jgi:hypothetical protein
MHKISVTNNAYQTTVKICMYIHCMDNIFMLSEHIHICIMYLLHYSVSDTYIHAYIHFDIICVHVLALTSNNLWDCFFGNIIYFKSKLYTLRPKDILNSCI